MSTTGTQDLFGVDEGDTLKKRIEVEQAESSGDSKKEAHKYMANVMRKPAMTISGVFAEQRVKAKVDSDSDSESMAMASMMTTHCSST